MGHHQSESQTRQQAKPRAQAVPASARASRASSPAASTAAKASHGASAPTQVVALTRRQLKAYGKSQTDYYYDPRSDKTNVGLENDFERGTYFPALYSKNYTASKGQKEATRLLLAQHVPDPTLRKFIACVGGQTLYATLVGIPMANLQAVDGSVMGKQEKFLMGPDLQKSTFTPSADGNSLMHEISMSWYEIVIFSATQKHHYRLPTHSDPLQLQAPDVQPMSLVVDALEENVLGGPPGAYARVANHLRSQFLQSKTRSEQYVAARRYLAHHDKAHYLQTHCELEDYRQRCVAAQRCLTATDDQLKTFLAQNQKHCRDLARAKATHAALTRSKDKRKQLKEIKVLQAKCDMSARAVKRCRQQRKKARADLKAANAHCQAQSKRLHQLDAASERAVRVGLHAQGYRPIVEAKLRARICKGADGKVQYEPESIVYTVNTPDLRLHGLNVPRMFTAGGDFSAQYAKSVDPANTKANQHREVMQSQIKAWSQLAKKQNNREQAWRDRANGRGRQHEVDTTIAATRALITREHQAANVQKKRVARTAKPVAGAGADLSGTASDDASSSTPAIRVSPRYKPVTQAHTRPKKLGIPLLFQQIGGFFSGMWRRLVSWLTTRPPSSQPVDEPEHYRAAARAEADAAYQARKARQAQRRELRYAQRDRDYSGPFGSIYRQRDRQQRAKHKKAKVQAQPGQTVDISRRAAQVVITAP